MKTPLLLWTIVLATFVQTQEIEPDCSVFTTFPWFINNPISCGAYWYCSHVDAVPYADECPNNFNFNEESQYCEDPDEFPCDDPEDPEPTDPPSEPTESTTESTTDPTTTTTRPTPPRNACEGQPDGRFVNNPTGCRSFFECQNEIAFPRQCDMGLNFNEELQICDRPSFTPCSNDDFECPFYGISRWEVPGSCIKYNFCFAGQHRVETCAPGLTFDSDISLCSLEENVNCERDLCPLTNDIDNIVTYPSEVDCEQYYKCYDNNRELQFCAPGTHWNQDNQRCERPEDAQCELATEPPEPTEPTDEPTEEPTDEPTEEPTTETPIEIECPPSERPFRLPHPFICRRYFICANEQAYEFECLDGLLFDALQMDCNIADQATCAEGATFRNTKQKDYFMKHIAKGI